MEAPVVLWLLSNEMDTVNRVQTLNEFFAIHIDLTVLEKA